MAPTNVYFDHDYEEEQNLYESLTIEALSIYGQETYYIPRSEITDDEILNEKFSRFSDAYAIEMYIENTQGFEGEGTLLSKFGLEIRDQANFIVSKRRFRQLVHLDDNDIYADRPDEGDLIYLPLANSLFEIKFVEHEQPFYQLRNLPTYQLQCELFEYSHEQIETGIPAIDQFETAHGTPSVIEVSGGTFGFAEGDEVSQLIREGRASTAKGTANVNISTGEVTGVTITETGFGYRTPPTVVFPQPSGGAAATATTTIDSEGAVDSVTITDPGVNYVGDVSAVFEQSPADPIERIEIFGEVAEFKETEEADPTQGQERRGDLILVNVSGRNTSDSIYTFSTEGDDLVNLTQTDHPSDWSVTRVYDLEDIGDRYIDDSNDDFADNSRFEIDSDDIIDFSESNPFGEP